MCDVINKVLFKHEAPVTNGVDKRLFEWAGVNTKPVLKQHDAVQCVNLSEQLLVRVNLVNSYTSHTVCTWISKSSSHYFDHCSLSN